MFYFISKQNKVEQNNKHSVNSEKINLQAIL